MKKLNCLYFLLLSLSLSPALAGEVSVVYLPAEKYQDVGNNPRDIDRTLHGLEQHLQKMGQQYLPPSQKLKLEVLDIDLAGRYESWQPNKIQDVRIMRSSTWPQIKLRYTLLDGAQVLRQGEETISDFNYLDHTSQYAESDPLRYEKQMLEDWFRNRLSKPQKAIGN